MLSTELKSTIQANYRQFLKQKKLSPRHGQKLMIANIANTIGNIKTDSAGKRIKDETPHLCVVEAGTGTGKTVAYLLAAIPIAKALNKKLVISTATVALQEQIIHKDLPEVKNNTHLSFNFTLAKGRGRYLCLSKLDRLLSSSNSYKNDSYKNDSHTKDAFALYEQDMPQTDEQSLNIYNNMVDALAAGKWDGDRDNWEAEIDSTIWTPVTTNHRECTGRRCSNVSACSFFKARESIDRYDCIVANHDLVLADLALGGGAILPLPEETIYIFDEGHHLPDKALSHFAYHTRIAATSKWLDQAHKTLSAMLSNISGAGRVDHYAEQLPSVLTESKQKLEALYPYCQQLMDDTLTSRGRNDAKRHRFESGIPPALLVESATNLSQQFDRLTSLLNHINNEIQEAMENSYCSTPKADLETWLPVIGNWQARAEANLSLWKSYAKVSATCADDPQAIPLARWITVVEFSDTIDFELCSSPILASNTLKYRLWQECYGAIVTSATLTALGKYDRFIMRSGTSPEQHYSIMPSPFDFSKAILQVPDFSIEANYTQEHTATIIQNLPELIAEQKGTLMLFSSRKQMEEVFYQLSESLRKTILIQGERSKQTMLIEHKKIIDSGQKSCLFGLASFAEGVDLPGHYCQHVIIAKLPFAVPDDPIEASLAEWIEQKGGNAFMDITIPDAAMKLVQACGRLLRKETDSGKITILDRRLITKRYGKLLLNCLPEYQLNLANK